jgi:hypothetical protein
MEHALVLRGKCVRANMRWNLGQTVPARAGDPTADTALSYTWGAPNPTFNYTVNGNKGLQIRENLHRFLQTWYQDGYLWVD